MNKIVILSATLLLSSCASSSGVMKMGKDTYTVSTGASPARGGQGGARQMAFAEGNEYCAKLGKEFLLTNESGRRVNSNGMPGGSADITFRCLDANDPEFQKRPDYQSAPDITIEHR